MRVRMTTRITGFRQGRPWPPVGETIDVGDREGAQLIQAGYAQEVTADEGPTGDTGGPPADPPGPDGPPSDQPDGEPDPQPDEEDGQAAVEWPRHVGGPVFELSDGSRVKGKAAAERAQAALDRG